MGMYLIPNAMSINEAVDFLGEPGLTQTWRQVPNGVLFEDTSRSDAQCAALYAGYVPSGTSDLDYQPPLPPAVQQAKNTLKAFWDTNPASIDDTQSARLWRAWLTWYRWKSRDLTDD